MRKNGNAGWIQRSDRDLTLEMVKNVKPWRSLGPMSIVTFSNFIPYDLCIVKAHAIQSGIF